MSYQPVDYRKAIWYNSEHEPYVKAIEQLLADRTAKCLCDRKQPSSTQLPFFEYRGVGSDIHYHCGTCGKTAEAHWPHNPHTDRPGVTDHDFVPKGASETDTYYCGCRGWD